MTATLPVPPPAATLAVVGAMENAQALSCDTVNVCPPMVRAPERGPPLVASALNWTVPLPLPLAPDVTVNHDALLTAVQAQSGAVVTATLPVPPAAGSFALVGAMAKAQPLPCVTRI